MIANNLATLLTERKIKITRLAKETGISRSTITSIAQNDTKMIQLEVINQICMYLEITPEDFFVFTPIDMNINHKINNLKVDLDDSSLKFELDFLFEFTTKAGTDTFETSITIDDPKNRKKENMSSSFFTIDYDSLETRLILRIEDRSELFTEYQKKIPTVIWWNRLNMLDSELNTSISKMIKDYLQNYLSINNELSLEEVEEVSGRASSMIYNFKTSIPIGK
ncbi:hypothetical protein BFC20_10980 [Brochothrix thermosphacta]|nr:helix-turn-helix transcriptional regulator [Brochothrix thermosphacta]ANZ98187.1 hypothetical protein BFC20_10980 [Brochothrix thermosphacta]